MAKSKIGLADKVKYQIIGRDGKVKNDNGKVLDLNLDMKSDMALEIEKKIQKSKIENDMEGNNG